jgi:long-chain acyl-CoA synthetase
VIVTAIADHAHKNPGRVALTGDSQTISYGELWQRVQNVADWIRAEDISTLGIEIENGLDWVIADLAALAADIAIVPVPDFFSVTQREHVLKSAGVDCLLGGSPGGDAVPGLLKTSALSREAEINTGLKSCKVTFTSGSTGEPRGVIIRHDHLASVSGSIVTALNEIDVQKHLVMLPLATLLENVAGIYAPLMKGIEVVVPGPAETGLRGSSSLDAGQFAACLELHQPHTLILVPQLLMALATLTELEAVTPEFLRLVAVGGGKVGLELLNKSRDLGIPAYEGYGLSEAGSVVTLNLPGREKPGSVGQALPHTEIRVNPEGELEVRGALMEGYLEGDASGDPRDWLSTGDLGSIDEDGYVSINGRIKNQFITAYGRNVCPEWVEAQLLQHLIVGQALFYGEGRDRNLVVIWPRFAPAAGPADTDFKKAVDEIVSAINQSLPDYARIHHVIVPQSPLEACFQTSNGRLKREMVTTHYLAEINDCYQTLNIPVERPTSLTAN